MLGEVKGLLQEAQQLIPNKVARGFMMKWKEKDRKKKKRERKKKKRTKNERKNDFLYERQRVVSV